MHPMHSDHTRRQLELLSKMLEQAAEINRGLLAQMAGEDKDRKEPGETDGSNRPGAAGQPS